MDTLSRIALVDEEIGRQKMVLLDLYSHRNSLAFISRLPGEVMETIFIHCARDDHERFHFHAAPTWVNVSYVCHHWRNVALNCPALWSYHFMVSPRWTEEILARSKQAPLKIYIDKFDDHRRALNLLENVLDHGARMQDLNLDIPADFVDQVFSALSSCVPCPQNLAISVATSVTTYASRRPPVPFGGNTPALRTLRLIQCQMQWHSLQHAGLTSLTLRHVPDRFQQTVEDFLATLGCMHSLMCLHLDLALTSGASFLSSTTFHHFQKINLPHLSFLSISDLVSTVVALMSCVNFPSRTRVRLTCHSERELVHYALLSSVLSQGFSRSEQTSSTIHPAFVYVKTERMEVILGASERDYNPTVTAPHDSEIWDSNVALVLALRLEQPMNVRDRIVDDILCSFPLTTVRSVHFIHPFFSRTSWKRILGHLRDLRYMKLTNGIMPDLSVLACTELTVPDGAEGEGGLGPDDYPGHVLVPALEELELEWITFSPGADRRLGGPGISYQRLLDVLSTRNVPNGRLTMTHCRIGGASMLDTVRSWSDC